MSLTQYVGEANPTGASKPRLLDRVRAASRARHYSRRTEKAYVAWIRRYVLFHDKRHPADMGAPEADPAFVVHRTRIVEFAKQNRVPAMYPHREYAEAGGLMAYGTDLRHNYRRAATYVDKILKGAKASDLPVEQPTKFELVINAKTAKVLGLTVRHRCCSERMRSSTDGFARPSLDRHPARGVEPRAAPCTRWERIF